MELDDIFDFGKHSGEPLDDVILDDPSYIAWLYNEKDFLFSDDAISLMKIREVI